MFNYDLSVRNQTKHVHILEELDIIEFFNFIEFKREISDDHGWHEKIKAGGGNNHDLGCK